MAVGDQVVTHVTSLANGGYVVAWNSPGQDGAGFGVYAREFLPVGTNTAPLLELPVADVVAAEDSPLVFTLPDQAFHERDMELYQGALQKRLARRTM